MIFYTVFIETFALLLLFSVAIYQSLDLRVFASIFLWYANIVVFSVLTAQIDILSKRHDTFLKAHESTWELVNMVNATFGIKILLLVANVILNIVLGAKIILTSISKIISFTHGSLFYPIGIFASSNVLLSIIFVISLSVACDKTTTEANNTSTICYKILIKYLSCSRASENRKVKEELMLLADHISRRKVSFRAGFFAIDYTMLYMIFGCVTTYLVIVLQFK
ncbi:hypothetical protein NQ318_021278 [Aromia moschata]|uniref:Gustatory receptor n=1 Tax=Aromia moschata TaxID=1265417 RepID=A0AAV8ZDH3_9CUCU|nr:hypothetical protein NQ318_021278 [Aromia moschata]